MSTPYVTFPGTAGNYVSTADVNLVNTDVAHNHQAMSAFWVAGTGASGIQRSTDLTPIVGDYHGEWTSTTDGTSFIAGWGTGGANPRMFAASPGASYSVGVQVAAVAAELDTTIEVRVNWFSAAPADLGTSTVHQIAAPVAWTPIAVTVTAPANTAWGVVQIIARNTTIGDVFYWDAVYARLGSTKEFVRSVRIVGDLDLRAKCAADDWTPSAVQILLDEYVAGTGGYRLGIETSGAISLVAHGATGAISELSSGFTLVDGATTEIRVTMDASAGDLTWYQDGTEVDDDTYTAQALKAAGLDLYVGALSSDASHFAGNIYWVEIRDGIDGLVVRRFDTADVAGQLT